MNALQEQEQRRMMGGEASIECALYVKAKKSRRRQHEHAK